MSAQLINVIHDPGILAVHAGKKTHVAVVELVGPSSYATNGANDDASTKLASGATVLSRMSATSSDGTVCASYNTTTSKWKYYNCSDGAEVTATTDLSTAAKTCITEITYTLSR